MNLDVATLSLLVIAGLTAAIYTKSEVSSTFIALLVGVLVALAIYYVGTH